MRWATRSCGSASSPSIAFGGACAGLGGAYLSLIRVPQWTEGMTAGAGWIALAHRRLRLVAAVAGAAGRLSFRRIAVLQLNLQAAGVKIPVEYLSMSPVSDNDPRAGHHVLAGRGRRRSTPGLAGPQSVPRLG
jgi:hypothetical protein